MRTTAAFFSIILLAAIAHGQAWVEDFESGVSAARPYHNEAPQATLETSTDNPAQGEQYIRATLPGERKLEGFSLRATGLQDRRLATVTAKIRGSGDMRIYLHSGDRWMYWPETFTLTDSWQEVSARQVLTAGATVMPIYFISDRVQQGAVFEVDDVQVHLADPPQMFDTDVAPWRFEAENFSTLTRKITDAESDAAETVVEGDRFAGVDGFPFPRTSNPVTVYVRVKPASGDDSFRLTTFQSGAKDRLHAAKPGRNSGWQWVQFPPVTAAEVGSSFGIEAWRGSDTGSVAIDAVAVSTSDDLDDGALNAARPFSFRRPLAMVDYTNEPPTIDGSGDDACWDDTVACTNFLTRGSLVPAEADTVVRFCYDDDNLYVLFVCEEPILEHAAQRSHEFRAKATERDASMSSDDRCILLLDPTDTGNRAYDFIVNARGTLADAECTGPDLWQDRDLDWNSSTSAEGSTGDGRWTVEMAIPLADLSDHVPEAGELWQTSFGRLAEARDEVTAWNIVETGYHDQSTFGHLLFGEVTAPVRLQPPAVLQPGDNTLTAHLGPTGDEPAGVYLSTSADIAGDDWSADRSYTFQALKETPQQVEHVFDISAEGTVRAGYGALDAASLQPLYMSPVVTRNVTATTAELTLDCHSPWRLYVNDALVGRGQNADMQQVSVNLGRGANTFALVVEGGLAAVRQNVPGREINWENWRMAPADTEGATGSSTDDAEWETAPKVQDHPTLDAVIGTPDEPVVLRKTVLWQKTRVWPTPKPALFIAQETAQQINFINDGLPGRPLHDWTIHVVVPTDFEILGSTGYYGNTNPDKPRYRCTVVDEREVEGEMMQVAKIKADAPQKAGWHYINTLFNLYVRYRDDAGPPDDEYTVRYWTEANGGSIIEPPQSFNLRVLEAVDGRQPEKMLIRLSGGWIHVMDDESLQQAIIEKLSAAGINQIGASTESLAGPARDHGVSMLAHVNFEPWNINMSEYVAQHPDNALVDAKGQESSQQACMSALLDEAWPAVKDQLAKEIEESHPDALQYDYEYPPFTTHHSCYCDRCLEAFRDHAGLADDTELNPEVIRERHADEWVDFQAWRVAKLCAKMREAIHEIAPGTEFYLYSGYQTPDNPLRYG
ncbi:MAG: sugar-binding protein, partial [Armatimonadota bacterium]